MRYHSNEDITSQMERDASRRYHQIPKDLQKTEESSKICRDTNMREMADTVLKQIGSRSRDSLSVQGEYGEELCIRISKAARATGLNLWKPCDALAHVLVEMTRDRLGLTWFLNQKRNQTSGRARNQQNHR